MCEKKDPRKKSEFFFMFFLPSGLYYHGTTTGLKLYHARTLTCTYSTTKYHPNFVRFIKQ